MVVSKYWALQSAEVSNFGRVLQEEQTGKHANNGENLTAAFELWADYQHLRKLNYLLNGL